MTAATVDACDETLVASMRVMAAWQEDHAFIESAGALVVRGHTRFPTLYANCVIARVPDPDPDELFAAASRALGDRHFVVWTREHADRRLNAKIGDRGCASLGTTPAMVLDSRIGPHSGSRDLVARRVEARAELDDFIVVSAEAYAHTGMPEGVVRKLFTRFDPSASPDVVLAVVYAGDSAVAAAMSIVVGELAGVYWVGTRPSARGRGAGTLATHFVTHAALAAGARVVSLQASAEGERIYRKMGYRAVTSYGRHLAPKPDAGG